MTETKPWWKSKTMIFNIVTGLLSLLATNIEVLRGVLPDNWVAWILFASIVGNGILRVVTTKPLAAK